MLVLLISLTAVMVWSEAVAQSESADKVLRVCADPDNLPLSNDRGEGYENKIAENLAHDLGRKVEYTYFPQRLGFVRNTLRRQDPMTQQFKCDVIIGVPKGYELTATTRPYMRSTYALLFRYRSEFETFASAEDLLKLPQDKLRALRIGVFAQSPGADWLLRNELLDRAVFYASQSGDPHETPASILARERTRKESERSPASEDRPRTGGRGRDSSEDEEDDEDETGRGIRPRGGRNGNARGGSSEQHARAGRRSHRDD